MICQHGKELKPYTGQKFYSGTEKEQKMSIPRKNQKVHAREERH